MNTTEIVQPNLFPFPFPHHLIFCCVAMLFFAFMYIKYKKPHQFVFAVAIPFSLIIWISNSRLLFYTVGIVEVIAILLALILNIWHKKKYPEFYAKETSKSDSKGESDTKSETEPEEDTEQISADEISDDEDK